MSASTLWDFEFHVEYSENDLWKHPTANEHFHRVYEIYYLVKNEVNYFIENKSLHIKEGTVVIVPPNVIHSTRCINNHSRKRFLIYIPENFINEFLHDEPEKMEHPMFTDIENKEHTVTVEAVGKPPYITIAAFIVPN